MENKLHELREALDALPRCVPRRTRPSITLSREGYQKSAYLEDECIWLKSACKEESSKRLRDYYLAAKQAIEAYTEEYEPDSFATMLRAVLHEHTANLHRQLECVRSCATAVLVDEIDALLNPDQVMEHMGEASAELKARYPLGSLSIYLPLIRYEVCDPSDCEEGVMWLVAKAFCRYGYDLLDAIHRMDEDAAKMLRAFQEAFCTQAESQIRRLIVEPAQTKLTQLNQILEGEN